MPEEYESQDFPEMETSEEEISAEYAEEYAIPDELQEQTNLESIESSSDAQDVFSVPPEYPPKEISRIVSQDSSGTLFLPGDDPIRKPVIAEPLDPHLVYTRRVPKRLRHLTCERRGPEYHRPTGFYRPGN